MDNLKLDIARTLYNNIFPYIRNEKKSVFLIGKSTKDPSSLRKKLRDTFEQKKYISVKFEIYYPEEIFSDLLYNGKIDLLTLENLLAKSVHAVVICLESPGSIAEMGAFVNHNVLNKKLVLLVDSKYRKAKSFIRKGPIRFLEATFPGQVLWYNINDNINDIAKRTRSIIYKVSNRTVIQRNLQNPIIVEDYLLMVIYALGAANASELVRFIKEIESMNPDEAATVCVGALNALFKRRALISRNNNYILTRQGYNGLIESLPQKNKSFFIETLDDLRIRYLNKSLRNCN